MNHSRWHYLQGRSAEILDKLGYYSLRTYWHKNVTARFAKPDLQGWFSQANQHALAKTLEKACSGIKNPRVLEIGSWKGLSTSVIASYLKKNNGQICCVDSWQGNEGVGAIHRTAQYKDILSTFRRNMNLLGYGDLVHPLVGRSKDVLPLLRDESFDLVFIDADHRKTPFTYDLEQALRLSKKNGVICGDDCDEKYIVSKDAFYKEHCEEDYYDRVHCGVVLALHETLGFNDIELVKDSSFWVFKKDDKKTLASNKQHN